jgi:hypothetical protein
VYAVTGDPPLLAGGPNETVACPLSAVASTLCGAPGVVAGMTVFDGTDANPIPSRLLAITVNVYDVPFVSPLTVIGLAVPVALTPPGCDTTV